MWEGGESYEITALGGLGMNYRSWEAVRARPTFHIPLYGSTSGRSIDREKQENWGVWSGERGVILGVS